MSRRQGERWASWSKAVDGRQRVVTSTTPGRGFRFWISSRADLLPLIVQSHGIQSDGSIESFPRLTVEGFE
jgi:hypothetical protein